MKVSIVIALYNTETYIEKCIRSVYLENTLPLSEFEVIVINDGSTDRSRAIVEDLQREYINLHLINKENGGQSTARNIGFRRAKGKYLFCLDSDDWINIKEFEKALDYLYKNNLDILPVFFQVYTEHLKVLPMKKDNYSLINDISISGGEFMNRFTISGSMWRYFYKTSIIRDNSLYLIEGVYHEDEDFVIKFLSYSNKIRYGRHKVYNYVIHNSSTVNKKDKCHRIRLLYDLISVVASLRSHREQFVKSSLEHKGISKKIEQLLVSIFLRMKSDNLTYPETRQFVKKLKSLNLYPIIIKESNIKFRLAAFLFNVDLYNRFYYK